MPAHEWESWVLPRKPSQEPLHFKRGSRLRKWHKVDSNIYYCPFFWGYPELRSSYRPSGEPISGMCCGVTAAVPQPLLALSLQRWHLPLLSSSFALFPHWDSRAFMVAAFEWLTRKTKAMRNKCYWSDWCLSALDATVHPGHPLCSPASGTRPMLLIALRLILPPSCSQGTRSQCMGSLMVLRVLPLAAPLVNAGRENGQWGALKCKLLLQTCLAGWGALALLLRADTWTSEYPPFL